MTAPYKWWHIVSSEDIVRGDEYLFIYNIEGL